MYAQPSLTISRLSCSYRSRTALKDVTMTFAPTRVTAVIGPSGSGKSTLLCCLNRLTDLMPEAEVQGSVFLDGQDIFGPEMDVIDLRRRVGLVFQEPHPFPFSIFENVAYGIRLQGGRSAAAVSEKVEECLRSVALWEEVKDRLHGPAIALSSGERQRLCIARALAVEPEILLLDEPTGSLDPGASSEIEELIRNLKRSLTIVLVTHNIYQAARISDDAAFFDRGRLVEMDSTDTLFTRPRRPETEAYLTGRY